MGRPFTRKDGSTGHRSSRYLYEVEIKERATYKVLVRAGCCAEAIKHAEKHFLSKEGICIAPPWDVEVHDRRAGATLKTDNYEGDEVLP